MSGGDSAGHGGLADERRPAPASPAGSVRLRPRCTLRSSPPLVAPGADGAAPGTVTRRYEREQPGDLVHVDINMLGKLRLGGG